MLMGRNSVASGSSDFDGRMILASPRSAVKPERRPEKQSPRAASFHSHDDTGRSPRRRAARECRDPLMEIQALRLLITEQDLNELIAKHLADDLPLENLELRLAPEGLSISGEYPLWVRVAFDTLWALEVQEGKLLAHLASLKAMGLPATVFKGTVLKAIEDAVQAQDWMAFENDCIIVDLDRLLAGQGIPLKTNLSAVQSQHGSLVILASGAA
jgi:hypothetical protein